MTFKISYYIILYENYKKKSITTIFSLFNEIINIQNNDNNKDKILINFIDPIKERKNF